MGRVALRRNERLFTTGQRTLMRDPAAAVEPLRAAATASPRDAQARLFLAIAQADAGQPDAALATLAEALAIEPANAVLLAETGVVHLDEGRAQEALAIFEKAAAMAPANALCAVWPLLAKWDLGDLASAAALATRTRDRAARFQARVLLRVERAFLETPRPAIPKDGVPPPLRRFPTLLDRVWDAPRVRARARSLIAKQKFDAAASILLQAREDYEGDELLAGMLPVALEGALRETTAEIQELTKKIATAKTGVKELQEDRRDAVFRLADSLLQLERWSEAAPRLDEWWESHLAAGSPAWEGHYAVALCIAASDTAARLGRFDVALEWADRARSADPDRKEVLRAEAIARIGKGGGGAPLRAARRLLERFLDGSLYAAEDRLRELITGTKAFIAT